MDHLNSTCKQPGHTELQYQSINTAYYFGIPVSLVPLATSDYFPVKQSFYNIYDYVIILCLELLRNRHKDINTNITPTN